MGIDIADSNLKKRELKQETKITNGHWSGAKTIEGGMSLETGIARIKCGRSDLTDEQRSMSMSCSDKILLWSILGFQGNFLRESFNIKLVFDSINIEISDKSIENYETIRRGIDPYVRSN